MLKAQLFNKDHEKSFHIAEKLYDDFYNHKGFFKDYQMPEYVLPRNLNSESKEYACYLTFIISIDYGTDANRLWRKARETYIHNPEYFDPKAIISLDEKTLTSIIKELGFRYPKTGSKAWKKIANILIEKYDGDPRNLTPQPLTIKEVKSKLDEFPHLRGKKLSNFYIRSMAEKGLLNISDFHNLDVPVDIQVARFTLYTGVLKPSNESFTGCIHNNPLRGLIEDVWREAAQKIGTSPWKLDEPIWTIGSKLCTKKLCNTCPVESFCNKNFDITFKGSTMFWNKRN